MPPEVLVPAGDRRHGSALGVPHRARRGSRVVVRTPLRGEKRRLVELAAENARLALESDAAVREAARSKRIAALEELREVLNLESLPVRIECFDVSNIQGESIVASMTSSSTGSRRTRTTGRSRSAGSRARTTSGRCARWFRRGFARARGGDPDESFSRMPNLVVVDGGKGQLAAALAAIEELDLPRVAVIALAKREEEVFVPGVPAPIALDRSSPALQLLQRIRDEAHRVALRYHRRKRGARSMETIFEGLPGVGPVRRRAIIPHFGSVERFLEASQEELEGVPGLPQKTARDALRAAPQGRPVLAIGDRRRLGLRRLARAPS